MAKEDKSMKMGDHLDYEEPALCRQLTKEIVNNVIELACEQVSRQMQSEIKSTKFTKKRPPSLQLTNPTPCIQIDLVPSRTPTPEEQNEIISAGQQEACQQRRKIRVKIAEGKDEDDLKNEEKAAEETAEKRVEEGRFVEHETVQKTEDSGEKNAIKKKTCVNWSDSKEKDENKEQESSLQSHDDSSDKMNKFKVESGRKAKNQTQSKANKKADISNENYEGDSTGNIINDKKASKTTRFASVDNDVTDRRKLNNEAINWPSFDSDELNRFASRFVQQIIEDASWEVGKQLEPSTSGASDQNDSIENVIKVYIAGINSSAEIRSYQQRSQFILDSLKIDYESIDITDVGNEEIKNMIREKCKHRNNQPPKTPQFFNDDIYCGDWFDFEIASDEDRVLEWLGLEDTREEPQDDLPVVANEIKGNDEKEIETEESIRTEIRDGIITTETITKEETIIFSEQNVKTAPISVRLDESGKEVIEWKNEDGEVQEENVLLENNVEILKDDEEVVTQVIENKQEDQEQKLDVQNKESNEENKVNGYVEDKNDEKVESAEEDDQEKNESSEEEQSMEDE